MHASDAAEISYQAAFVNLKFHCTEPKQVLTTILVRFYSFEDMLTRFANFHMIHDRNKYNRYTQLVRVSFLHILACFFITFVDFYISLPILRVLISGSV